MVVTIGSLFLSRTSNSLFGRKPSGMGLLTRYIVNFSSPVFCKVKFKFAGTRTVIPLKRSIVFSLAVIVPFPERMNNISCSPSRLVGVVEAPISRIAYVKQLTYSRNTSFCGWFY